MWLELLVLLVGLLMLYFGGDWLVDGASRLAASMGVETFVIGLTIVAIGTSAPEATLAVVSASQGEAILSFGDVVGSNITNIGLVLAVACAITLIVVRLRIVRNEAILLVVSISAVALLGLDGTISRAEGLLLLASALAFNIFVLRAARKARVPMKEEERPAPAYGGRWRHVGLLLAGIGLLAAGSQGVLWGATSIAMELGASEFLIGMTVVAFGTSIPELAVSIASALKKETRLLLGNLLGSNISNSLLVVGLASSIGTVHVPDEFFTISFPIILVLYGTLLAFMYARGVLSRITSVIFIAIYIAYMAFILLA